MVRWCRPHVLERGYVWGILFGLYLQTPEERYRLVTRLSGRPGPVHSRGVQGLDILLSDGGRRPLISAADESLLYLLVTRSLQELDSPVRDKDFTVFGCYYSRKITMHWMWKCLEGGFPASLGRKRVRKWNIPSIMMVCWFILVYSLKNHWLGLIYEGLLCFYSQLPLNKKTREYVIQTLRFGYFNWMKIRIVYGFLVKPH